MKKRRETAETLGGESSCFAHLLCETCGAVLDGTHDQPCLFDDQHERAARVTSETESKPTT